MQTREAILNRRSVRAFDGAPIPVDTLRDIVRDAQRTPSWANSQPWKVWIAIGGTLKEIKRDHLQRSYQGFTGNADFSIMHREDWDMFPRSNMRNWYRQFIGFEGQGGQQFGTFQANLFNAAALAYLTIPKRSAAWSIYDLGAFSQTLMLAAFDRGIDSIAAYEIVKFPDSIRSHLHIPNEQAIAMGIGLGYRSDEHLNGFVSDRVPLDEMLVIEE